jgi:DNA replication and repair protein RecF
MKITKLILKNFRNYNSLELNLNDKINIFIGNNAQGKTNILESIYILAITKSHRGFIDDNLIKKGEEFFKITGTIIEDNLDKKMEILLTKKEKKVKINNNEIKKLSDYISNLNIIIFCPDDLDIIKGSPIVRRNFLNIEISQMSNKYIKILNEYNKLLKNRNEYLKIMAINNISDKRYFNVITEKLIDIAIEIYLYRKNFIEKINNNIQNIYSDITLTKNLNIKYNSFIDENIEINLLKETLIKKYNDNLKKEMDLGNTLIGPHKDDFIFFIGEEELKKYGSQGQQRAAVLSLKLSEIEIFKEMKSNYPILLLDDIFSELDEIKKNNLIKYINSDFQTIITTTDINDIDDKLIEQAKLYLVDNGKVTEYKKEVN